MDNFSYFNSEVVMNSRHCLKSPKMSHFFKNVIFPKFEFLRHKLTRCYYSDVEFEINVACFTCHVVKCDILHRFFNTVCHRIGKRRIVKKHTRVAKINSWIPSGQQWKAVLDAAVNVVQCHPE